MQLDDRCGKLRSVESLMQLDDRSGKLRSVESFWLLARNSESLCGPDVCNARVVRNGESLRGLHCRGSP